MVCKLVDVVNICVVLAIVIEPDLVPRHSDNTLSPSIVHEDGTDVNNVSSVNASSYAVGRRIMSPSTWQNTYQYCLVAIEPPWDTAFSSICLYV